MKKITLFLCFILAVAVVKAESPIKLGIKAGYNSSKISIDSNQFKDGTVNNYLAGAFLRLNLGKIHIQPEAYFNSKGGVLKELSDNPLTAAKNDFDLKTIDVPILVGVKLLERRSFNLRANAGPLMSFVTSKDIEGSGFDKNDLEDNFFGWQYGLGMDFLFFSLDARMESSSGDIYSGPHINDSKSKMFIVSLGINLL